MTKLKSYESFLIFSSNISIKDLNILSLYYKEKLKKWGSSKVKSKLYFLNSTYINNLNLKNNLLFCLKIEFNFLSKNISLFNNLLKLNLKIKKFLILLV